MQGIFNVQWLIAGLEGEKHEVGSHGQHKFLQEFLLFDIKDHISLTVWENLIDKIPLDCIYSFQNVCFKN